MTGSNVRHSAPRRGGNVAAPHAEIDGKVAPIAPFDSDNTNPAGGINSNADDMAKWMTVLLARGKLADGSRLFSEATWRQITRSSRRCRSAQPPPELAAHAQLPGYALGLNVQDYRGQRMLIHTGGLPGYVSRVMMVPGRRARHRGAHEPGIGRGVRRDRLPRRGSLPRRAGVDWAGALPEGRATPASLRRSPTPTARPPAARRGLAARRCRWRGYAGTYTDAWYGDIDDRAAAGQAGDALRPHAVARRRPRALAVRHVHRAVARPRAARRCLRDLRAQARTARSSRRRCAPCRPRPTSASISRICCWKPVRRQGAPTNARRAVLAVGIDRRRSIGDGVRRNRPAGRIGSRPRRRPSRMVYYWSEAKPALRIASGDIIDVDTLLTNTPAGLERAGVQPDDIQASLRAVVDESPTRDRAATSSPVRSTSKAPSRATRSRCRSSRSISPIAYGYNGCSGFVPRELRADRAPRRSSRSTARR